jgi:putative pyruvate formate lyase activating enzyme
MALSFEDLIRPGCRLCPRRCGVDREGGEIGYCGTGSLPRISQAGAHHGEEPPLAGRHGSGTVFLTGCNLHCVFCQNHDISTVYGGEEMTPEALAETALSLESRGCHNVNFVTPTHHSHVIASAITLARDQGLTVPVVYNCGGYESPETLDLLKGRVEIYMPDVKFFDPEACRRFMKAPDYGAVVQEALKIMQEQVGDLVLDGGLARQGLLIRHLVMPGFTEDALAIMDFIHREISNHAFVNVMGQYWPSAEARQYPEISRGVSHEQVEIVRDRARSLGLRLAR